MYERLGEIIEDLCRKGQNEAILVAPFIKQTTFRRLLDALPASVSLICITRWRPEEVAVGVSDPEIWLDIQQREGAELRLCPSLHAKYYRIDVTCLIGSANLTGAALGWSIAPNLEILHTHGGNMTELLAFEKHLMTASVRCNDSLYQQIIDTAGLIKAELPPNALLTGEAIASQIAEIPIPYEANAASTEPLPSLSVWLPQCRQPADLFFAYSEQWSRLTSSSLASTLFDLAILQIPSGLPQSLFANYVSIQLLQAPCIASVDEFVTLSQRFGAVKAHLQSLPCADTPTFDASRSWQTLMRWLLYFLPERYEYSVPRHSEVFQRRR